MLYSFSKLSYQVLSKFIPYIYRSQKKKKKKKKKLQIIMMKSPNFCNIQNLQANLGKIFSAKYIEYRQGPIQKIRTVSNISQKGHFFKKKVTKNFPTPYSIPFLSVMHQNKALHNFHKRRQHPNATYIKGLDKGLIEAYIRRKTITFFL